jgi:hypothetical protein
MQTYGITGNITISVYTEVKAETQEAALEEAGTRPIMSLCHQCASHGGETEWATTGELDGDCPEIIAVDGEEISPAQAPAISPAPPSGINALVSAVRRETKLEVAGQMFSLSDSVASGVVSDAQHAASELVHQLERALAMRILDAERTTQPAPAPAAAPPDQDPYAPRRYNATALLQLGIQHSMPKSRQGWRKAGRPTPSPILGWSPVVRVRIDGPDAEAGEVWGVVLWVSGHGQEAGVLLVGEKQPRWPVMAEQLERA